jgi:hypothetical protein
MVDYRCCFIDGVGAIRLVEAICCIDDTSALLLARQRAALRPEYPGYEVWQGRRRVHVEMKERV